MPCERCHSADRLLSRLRSIREPDKLGFFMNDTWLITITTTSPADALLLALEFEGCEIEHALRSDEVAGAARPRAEHATRSIRTSMTIPPELQSAAAANEGWPE